MKYFYLLPLLATKNVLAASASTPPTITDLVRSTLYYSLVTIGVGYPPEKKLHPRDFITLHQRKRLVNFRGLWKDWCKSLDSKPKFEAAKKEFEDAEENFWEVMNGECLFLGPITWMEVADIELLGCAPLLEVPDNADTSANAPNDENIIEALLKRTSELKAMDSRSFLVKSAISLPVVKAYVEKLSWESKIWDLFNISDYEHIDFEGCLPPAAQFTEEYVPRLLRKITYARKKHGDSFINKYICDLGNKYICDLRSWIL